LNLSVRLRYVVSGVAVFLALHFLCLTGPRSFADVSSLIFETLAPLLATAICIWSFRQCQTHLRLSWLLVSIGFALWTTAMVLVIWEELFRGTTNTVAMSSDFPYFYYGVFILLAISLPIEGEWSRAFLVLDSVQVAVAGFLTFVVIFSVIPFTGPIAPVTGPQIIKIYHIENLVLAIAATLRLLSCTKKTEAWHFYRMLTGYLWTYAVLVGASNELFLLKQNSIPYRDLLVTTPFLVFTGWALILPKSNDERQHATNNTSLGIFIDSASPIFFTLAILGLGIAILKSHFLLGILVITFALISYGFRATVLQTRYMRSQRALQQARDRLEELSLQDGLTGVANRRCFDQMLELEWNRATRTQQQLSLLLIDVDYFKNLNDRYGHQRGDECLVQIASALKSTVTRSVDLLARYGGEEFAAILPDTNRNGAEAIASRMQEAVRELNIQNETSIGRFATISIGIATYELPNGSSSAVLVEASDRALYIAKRNGRNRIEYKAIHGFHEASSAEAY